ncbi:hypothetical protein ACFL47_01825 [Candidatus Latescibacterota bacterium]
MKKYFFALTALMLCLTTSPSSSCTIFTASRNGITLAGNNEDFIDPATNVWFISPTSGKYGRMYWGFGVGLPQGGMNVCGLFFDCAATKPCMFTHADERPQYESNPLEKMIEECATVDEALRMLGEYDLRHMFRFQVMIADRTGDSAIIEGETIIRRQGDYQVATNFRQSLDEETPYSLDRYTSAVELLNGSDDVTVDLFRSVLDATHQAKGSQTQYSNICDLVTGDVYFYLFHNFDVAVSLNLFVELKKGNHSYEIPSLFDETSSAFKEYSEKNKREQPAAVSGNPTVFDSLVGEYQAIPQVNFTITRDGDRLFGRMRGFAAYELIPESDMVYHFNEFAVRFTFVRGDDGEVDSLVFCMYDTEKMSAKKIK